MGYVYDRDTDDMVYTDEGDQPLSPMETAINNGTQDDLLQATDEYYNNPGTGAPVNIDEHPGTNWFDPGSYEWLINDSQQPNQGSAPTPGTPTAPQSPNQSQNSGSNSGGGGGGFGGYGGGLLNPYPGRFTPPDADAAAKAAIGRLPPLDAFKARDLPSVQPFQSPSWDQFRGSDPSYQGRVDEGSRALMNSKSAQGLVRTGGTLKDLLQYNSDFAGRNYGDYWNREKSTYDTNVGNQFNEWDRGFAADKAEYEPKVLKYTTEAGVGERGVNNAFDQAWKQFLGDYSIWQDQRDSSYDKLMGMSRFGLDASK